MIKIKVSASKKYDILVEKGLVSNCGSFIKEAAGGKKAALISDDNVYKFYGEEVTKSLSENGYEVFPFVFPHGEEQKNPSTFIKLLEFLGEKNLTRTDIAVALGGGVCGDLSGFAAASYQRGINIVHIPTTLLSMVDSSVGGKTAINLESGKNLAGAFFQPSLVLCDSNTLETLPEENFSEGLAEVIKYGILKEPQILDWVKTPHENIEKIIEHSIKIKRDIVEIDEFDKGERQTLNLGHTIGHAIEKLSNFKISHGNAVAIGMSVITKAAEKWGDCEKGTLEKLISALNICGLPSETDKDCESLVKYMLSDKKRDADKINLIIPKKIGECMIKTIPASSLSSYISAGLPLKKTLSPKTLRGEINAIASKSYAHRLLICAALSEKPSKIICPEISEDINATINVLKGLGAEISHEKDGFLVTPINKDVTSSKCILDCGESGSTLRFMLPVVSALGKDAQFIMKGNLPKRPLSPLYEILSEKGVTLSEKGKSPLSVSGKLTGNAFKIQADVSSQFISGLLFALPLLGGGTVEMTGKIESEAYINITMEVMGFSGIDVSRNKNIITVKGTYKMPPEAETEGDFSNTAFWICAGAIGNEPLKITNINPKSTQGDRKILEIAEKFGVKIDINEEEKSITVSPSKLKGINIDASQIPDLVPAVSILGALAEGETEIYNAGRLRIKESDRISAICDVMKALGADVYEKKDSIIFKGREKLDGGTVSSWNDHRIVMMSAIASLRCENPVTILDYNAVNKSYPKFFSDFEKLSL